MFRSMMILILSAGVSQAQPNPFEAHETGGGQPSEANPTGAINQTPPGLIFRKGALILGGSGLFSYTSASNGNPSGGDVENSTFFMRLTPSFGYMVTDEIEIGIAPGLLSRQIDRGGEGTTNESGYLIEATARYFARLTPAFSLFGGLGLGGSFGSSKRPMTLFDAAGEEKIVSETTDTSGFTLSLNAGPAYELSPRLQLRAFIELDWLFGSENVPSTNKDLDLSTLNAGLGLGLYYLF